MSAIDDFPNISNPRYSYLDIKTYEIIDSAFRLVGMSLATIDNEKSLYARRLINEILTEWISLGILQFNEKRFIVPLENNKSTYKFSPEVYEIYTSTRAYMSRLIGTPYGVNLVSGTPANAFSYNFDPDTGNLNVMDADSILGTDLSIHGSNLPLCIAFGICSNGGKSRFKLYGSNFDNETISEAEVLFDSRRAVDFSERNALGSMNWYCIENPSPFKYIFIQFNSPISLNKLYLLNYQQSIKMGKVGRQSMMSISSQLQQNNISGYSIEKTKGDIILRLRGVASNIPSTYNYPDQVSYPNFLYIEGAELPFSVNYLQDYIDIHYRFAGALKATLAFELSKEYAMDRAQFLGAEAARKFALALNDNKDPQSIQLRLPDYGGN